MGEENEEEYIPNLKNNFDNEIDNDNNNDYNDYQNNNFNNQAPRPTFVEITSQKVNANIEQINTIPEANLEKWNCVADYTP